MNEHDTRFDDAMRDLHRQALDAVTPATRQRLRAARTVATARRAHGGAWAVGASVAAVAALANGLQMGPLQRPAPATDPSAVAAGSTLPSTARVDESSVATLDENPDLYLWLASSDADLVALEY